MTLNDPREARKQYVLIVDDSSTVRMDLRAALLEAGFTVTACTSKASAEKILKTRPFDLYILDIVLGDGSGIDLLKEIRSTPGLRDAPVLILSSETDVRHRVRGLRVGADDYIGKPYNRQYVIKRARELIKRPQSDGPPSSTALVGKKILVVDDSPTYAARLSSALREDGHEIVLAASGEEAMELLAVDRVDAIVMDLHMPGMGGLEACRRIRADRTRASIPLLIMTGSADHEAVRAECLAAGADDVAMKSPELGLVKVRMRGLLRVGRRGAEGVESERPISSARRSSPSIPAEPSLPASLLTRVILATGLATGIGAGAVARACARAGVNAGTMSAADLRKAVPALRQMIRLFAAPGDVEGRMAAIEAIAEVGLDE
jgi:DNA-binding response OmpR family regulator